MPDRDPDPSDLLDLAVAAAERAAGLLRTRRPDPGATSTKSSVTDLVTDLDRAAEHLIVEHLLAARPDDGVLGEESGERGGTSGVCWVIDPLDGTTNYVYAYPAYGVSVAAQVGGRSVAGVVVDVTREQRYTAAQGGGSHLDGRPLQVSAASDLGTALLATGFSYDPGDRRRQAQALVGILPRVRDVRRSGSAALDLCALAAGHVDGFWERGLAPWDRAAGELIATEAGARIGELGPVGTRTLVGAGPGLYEPLEGLLDASGAAF